MNSSTSTSTIWRAEARSSATQAAEPVGMRGPRIAAIVPVEKRRAVMWEKLKVNYGRAILVMYSSGLRVGIKIEMLDDVEG